MRTWIDPLDRMLGTYPVVAPCDPLSVNVQPFTIALLRGAPGSGKTTLGLQILASHLERHQNSWGLFISLEVDPTQAVNAVAKVLPRSLAARLQDPQRMIKVNRATFEHDAYTYGDRSTVETHFRQFIETLQQDQPTTRSRHLMAMLDSMNLLANVSKSRSTTTSSFDLRANLYDVWRAIGAQFDSATLLVTGEYGTTGHIHSGSVISESHACDVEILLAAEPIAGHPIVATSETSALGYSIERLLPHRDGTGSRRHAGDVLSREGYESQSIELRSFCRVLKSRYSPNQSRRCAYDIIEGRGVVFAESLAGDANFLLFAENERQHEAWADFIIRDAPHQFPALRYALFDRTGLQRTLAIQRRHKDFPPKIDAHLVCFDTYWIRWYAQLCQRSAVRDALHLMFVRSASADLKQEILPGHHLYSAWARLLARIDTLLTALAESPDAPAELSTETLLTIKTEALAALYGKRAHPSLAPLSEHPMQDTWRRIRNGTIGLFHPLPASSLRLFGERRSELLPELFTDGHFRQLTNPQRCVAGPHLQSVPYNANISLLIVRAESLSRQIQRDTFHHLLTSICRRELAAFHWFSEVRHLTPVARLPQMPAEDDLPVPPDQLERLHQLTEARTHALIDPDSYLRSGAPPESWEELVTLCHMLHSTLLIETQTFDTFLCTYLEMFWSCGGRLEIGSDYTISEPSTVTDNLFRSLYLLCVMFERGTIAKYSSVEFAASTRGDHSAQPSANLDWLYARHWYSTLVDMLTAKDDNGEYKWKPPDGSATLDIAPLPYNLSVAVTNSEPPPPVSCWGEWHFALLRGSENETLAAELINDLMSSHRVCERAFTAAAVPTVSAFYEDYGDIPCLSIPERRDVTVNAPSYAELRHRYFKHAHSRNHIFDYRHCMRHLHSLLSRIHTDPTAIKHRLASEVVTLVDNIQNTVNRETMIH